MAYIVKQQDLILAAQAVQTVRCGIELLDAGFRRVDAVEGNLTGGSITVDAGSDIRNQCELTMVITDASFQVAENARLWLDKYLRVKVGLDSQRDGATTWYDRGLFLLSTAGYHFDVQSSTLSLALTDLMGRFTGIRGGQLSGSGVQIPAGSDIRAALVSAVTELGGMERYLIEDVGQPVPYDLKFSAGSHLHDVIAALRDLYAGWETFFDVDGTFVCRPIPTTAGDPAVLTHGQLHPLVVGEQLDLSLSEVKNVVEVWGADTEEEGQATATARDENPDSPFCVDKDLGELRAVLAGSPYDKIQTNDLCRQRAEYELWCRTRLSDRLVLETIPLYWLEVNQKFEYIPTGGAEPLPYIIKKLSIPLGPGTMTLEAIRFYPLYPDIVSEGV